MSKSPLPSRRVFLGAASAGAAALAAPAMSAETLAAVRRPLTPPEGRIPVAFLLDEGATVIDFAGPWETFQDVDVGGGRGFSLFTVAPTNTPIQTEGNSVNGRTKGLTLTADHTFDTAPQPAVIVIGAQGGGRLPAKLEWIRHAAVKADVVLSVCTGAFVLARTGLIDGMTATTHHLFYEPFAKEFPTVSLVRGRRFVDNGKYLSAGGLTSGIDAALHVVARYYGDEVADRTAGYMEHYSSDWRTGVPEGLRG